MSLLDDVSIVVTPNGYKAGELYAVIPVPTEGAEILSQPVDLVTDFVVNSGGIIVDADTFDTFGGTYDGIRKNSFLTLGKRYKLTIQGDTTSSGFDIGDTSGSGNQYGSGFGTFYFTAVGNGSLWIRQNTIGTTNITSFSIKEYTSADMDVTRATAATRVDENGLVNYAEVIGGEEVVNGDFSGGSTGWTVSNSDADNYVVFDGSTARLKFLNTSPVTELKTTDAILTGGKTYKLIVDIASVTSGAVKVDGNGISELFNTVGLNERIITPTGNASLGFYRATANVDLTFNSVSVKEVTRDSVPRIDYTGGGCPHILAEPMRTNLIPYSEDFNSWNTIQFVTVAEDTSETTSPSGNNTASKITINSASTARRLFEVISTSSGSDYTFTLYAKKGTTDFIRVYFSSSIIDISFDLTNGTKTVSSGTGSIEAVGNDWYRIQGTGTSSLTTEVPQIQLSNSASVNDYLYIWGAQTEEGSYATSYIPTSGSTVTRNQDIFTRDGIGSLINSTEGVLFLEMAALSDDGTNKRISLSDGTNTNRVVIAYSTSNNIQIFIVGAPAGTFAPSQSIDITLNSKIAVSWSSTEARFYVDGSPILVTLGDFSYSASTLSELKTEDGAGGNKFFGKVKQLQVYDTALTDTQLAALTS